MGLGAVSDLAKSDRPSWGFSPLKRHEPKRSVSPGFASPGTLRPRGFSPPRRFAPSPASRTRWVRCRSRDFRSKTPFGRLGRDALPRPLRSFAHGARQPRTLRNTRSQAPQARKHLSPTALVPWPWFQASQAPLRSTSFPDRRRGFRPRWSPHALRPSAAGRTIPRRAGASGCFTCPGTRGSTRDPQLPWGFRCSGRRSGAFR